ncbi:hypothetical protein LSTR_LSTR010819 [Laodelphax striatellus]|uniref:Uncharacterized protein n=1 Tax=Laodelphax striatellus TaxID=195883 RepID=A0A482XJ45_LAOST|nr:hypothetical protein LSTR_LSTR010819 [Laodelphax striatellus]
MGLNIHLVLMICVVINIITSSYHVDATFAPDTSFRRARTMTNWIYFRVPRLEALIIKLQSRSLHPGDMSCWKNLMSLTEFSSGFMIYFPTARRAESVFRGIKGPDSTVKSLLVNFFGFKKVHIALFEENPQKLMTTLDPASLKSGFGLQALDTIMGNTLGIAAKVCMELLADQYKVTPRPRTINHDYQKSVDALGNGWFVPSQN